VGAALRIGLGRVREASGELEGALLGQGVAESSTATGYGALADGLQTGFTLVYLAFAALAAYWIAADREQGIARQLLVRRVSRGAYVVSKYVLLVTLALGVSTLVGLASWIASASLYELGPVVEDGYELIGEEEIRKEIALAVRLALAPLPAAIALGLLVSVCARTPTGAVSTVLALTVAFDLFKGSLGDASMYVYAHYAPSLADASYLSDVTRLVRGFSDVFVEEGVLRLNALVPWPEALAFLGAAVGIAYRRE
jgi:hypothetical protein